MDPILDYYNDKKEMVDEIRYYSDHEEVRQQIALAGCQLVHERHSWEKVMRNILQIAAGGNCVAK